MLMKKLLRDIGVAAFVLAGVACAGQPAADTATTGQSSGAAKSSSGSSSSAKAAPSFREVTVPEGTTLSLTLRTAIDSNTNKVEDAIEATLAAPVLVGDAEVLPAGSAVTGTVAAVEGAAKVKGRASITVHFTSVAPAGRSDHYSIDASWSETARATKGADAEKIGIGAGAGAVIGGLLGGKGGAAKGAVIGGGAGTGVVLATKGKEVEHAAGASLTVTLKRSVNVRVPIR
jgi:hypothetical protein